jgi:Response regulator containing a CheY-like receiver domain and an HTH DNA-binding domain
MPSLRVLIRGSPRSLANDRGLLETDPDIAIVTDPSRADVTLLDLTDNDEPTLLPLPTNGTRVLILIGESAPASLMAEVLASEASVVTDAVSRDQLVSALRAVAGGLMVRNRSTVHDALPVRARPLPADDPSDALTPRERDILRLLGDGLANHDIARRSASRITPSSSTCDRSSVNSAPTRGRRQ